jgi:uncharacterized phage protein (TIGR01671 family)
LITRIKYRVWDHECKEFVDDMCIHTDGTLLCDCGKTGYGGDFTVQQYTGLKDKNDKEIYEGDILIENMMGNNQIGICKTVLGGWKIFCHPDSCICWHGNTAEIIGNIFENPELIKTEV